MKTSTKIALAVACLGTLGCAGIGRTVYAVKSSSPVLVISEHRNKGQLAESPKGDGGGETKDDTQEQEELIRLRSLAKMTPQQAQASAEAGNRGRTSRVKLENDDGIKPHETIKRPVVSNDPIIAAAGDIACDPQSTHYNQGNGTEDNCHMKATSDLLINANLAAVLPLGDTQYEYGLLTAFQQSYEPTWGRVKSISHPVVGNHEYSTAGAFGYFRYFGKAIAGDWKKGYYSYEIGSWHIIALNSNCSSIGGCGKGSLQEQWLKADLAAHPNTCTLAYWHHPRFSSGEHGNNSDYDAFWTDLYGAGAEIVLSGHDHDYERFAPQSPEGDVNPTHGIRQFVVGTGGKSHYRFKKIRANSQVRNADTYGVLKLTLHPQSYDWQFLPEIGKTFTDSGSDRCH